MNRENQKPVPAASDAPPRTREERYEPPRILSKRPVDRLTLFSGGIAPGNTLGGD